jgi:hypothetical protein
MPHTQPRYPTMERPGGSRSLYHDVRHHFPRGEDTVSERTRESLIMDDFNTEKDDIGTLLFRLDDRKVSGIPFFTDCAWVWPKPGEIVMEAKPHAHDFDEIVTVFGTNPDDPRDLCGEVEFWLDGAKHILTRSSIVYVPKGLKHCPMIFRNVTRPIFHYIHVDARTRQDARARADLREPQNSINIIIMLLIGYGIVAPRKLL